MAGLNAQPVSVDGESPAADLMAALALLTEVTESGPETSTPPSTGTVKGEEMKALSVMQLLQGLKLQIENKSESRGTRQKGEIAAENLDQLAAEIRSMFGKDGQLLPELEKGLKGRLNPAVTDRESQLVKLLEQIEDATSGEQSTGNQLAELLAAVNGLLTQVPRQPLDKKVEEGGDAKSATPVTVPVMATPQPTVPEAQKIEAGAQQKAADAEMVKGLPVADLAQQAATPESVKKETPSDEPTRDGMQPIPMKPQNAPLQIHPTAMKGSEIPENPDAQKQMFPKADSIEIVVKEETAEAVKELTQPAAQKPETVSSDRTQLFRSDNVMGVSGETRPSQAVSAAPAVEEPATTLTREQIAGQVREKLAEHRFTADNGQVTLRLHPAELGELKISMRMDDQRLRVEIVAENRTVKDALMENLGSLKEALARQNVEMKQFDVSTGSRQFFNQGFREGRQQEQQFAGTRNTGWLTGSADDPLQSGAPVWKARDNALLDMMM
jgi:flagellar hook-length control protein FliK